MDSGFITFWKSGMFCGMYSNISTLSLTIWYFTCECDKTKIANELKRSTEINPNNPKNNLNRN